ncbi:MAG: hypothetical protein IRZ05_17065, partial [Micromonosporaceae bacterium]|nr:hypothetical protein [Micromonosporaceae bacterium]
PPSEGRTARVWLGLGLGAAAVVLCCAGGLAAVVGLFVTGSAAINEQAHAAVEDYLQAVGAGRYGQAYRQLCDQLREQQSLSEFTADVTEHPRVREYELLKSKIRDDEVVVPANVTYTDRTSESVTYRVIQEGGELRFCGPTR